MIIEETTLDFIKKYADDLAEGYLVIDTNKLLRSISEGEHRYFAAFIDGEVAGFSAMAKYKHEGTVRIYHRLSYTFPKFRKRGVWISIMRHKAKYIEENNWCDTDTINAVSVGESDLRYEKIGWKRYDRRIQKVGDLEIPRITYYTRWENFKENV